MIFLTSDFFLLIFIWLINKAILLLPQTSSNYIILHKHCNGSESSLRILRVDFGLDSKGGLSVAHRVIAFPFTQ